VSSPSSESRTGGKTAVSSLRDENNGAGTAIDESLGDEKPFVSDTDAILRRSLRSRGEGKAEETFSEPGSDSEAIVDRRVLHGETRKTLSLIRDSRPEDAAEVAHERLAEACLICGYWRSPRESFSLIALA
jgi:hypothetical protein